MYNSLILSRINKVFFPCMRHLCFVGILSQTVLQFTFSGYLLSPGNLDVKINPGLQGYQK